MRKLLKNEEILNEGRLVESEGRGQLINQRNMVSGNRDDP